MKLVFKRSDGSTVTELEVVKAIKMKTDDKRLYLEPVNDGARLLWSTGLLDEFKDVSVIEVARSET